MLLYQRDFSYFFVVSNMNQLLIAVEKPEKLDVKTLFVERKDASMMLPALRSDYFQSCKIVLEGEIPKN